MEERIFDIIDRAYLDNELAVHGAGQLRYIIDHYRGPAAKHFGIINDFFTKFIHRIPVAELPLCMAHLFDNVLKIRQDGLQKIEYTTQLIAKIEQPRKSS